MMIQTAYKHVKISLTSLVIGVIQMKTTIRYYFTPTRVAGKKKSIDVNVEKLEFSYIAG